MNRTVVLFYSFEGSTKKVAEIISRALRCEMVEVKPVQELHSTGFSKYIWGGTQVFMRRKPDLHELSVDLNLYDTVLLGSPVWAWNVSPPIRTLLEKGFLRNKDIAFFCCHEGGPGDVIGKARFLIERNNRFLSAIDCPFVKRNLYKIKRIVSAWALGLR